MRAALLVRHCEPLVRSNLAPMAEVEIDSHERLAMTGMGTLRARMASAWLQSNYRLLEDSQPLTNPPELDADGKADHPPGAPPPTATPTSTSAPVVINPAVYIPVVIR